MARLYQKIDGEAVPLGGGGGSSVDIDGITITRNSSTNQIQVADSITSKVNELNNTASDANKVLTANGDGTASWKKGYVEGFYGTTAVWNALSYAQKKEWVQKNPKVTFTDDYVSNIKQTVSGCMSSIDENDVVGASALKEALTYSTTKTVIGEYLGNTLYRQVFNTTGTLPSGSYYNTSVPKGNIDKIVNASILYDAGGTRQYCPILANINNNVGNDYVRLYNTTGVENIPFSQLIIEFTELT